MPEVPRFPGSDWPAATSARHTTTSNLRRDRLPQLLVCMAVTRRRTGPHQHARPLTTNRGAEPVLPRLLAEPAATHRALTFTHFRPSIIGEESGRDGADCGVVQDVPAPCDPPPWSFGWLVGRHLPRPWWRCGLLGYRRWCWLAGCVADGGQRVLVRHQLTPWLAVIGSRLNASLMVRSPTRVGANDAGLGDRHSAQPVDFCRQTVDRVEQDPVDVLLGFADVPETF
jgi:hypothetical protein